MTVELGCCPGRPLLYTMCVLGILVSVASVGVARDRYSRVWAASTALYNFYCIFAAHQKRQEKLKFARHLALAILILSILPLFVMPIVATSYLTSGMLDQTVTYYYGDRQTFKMDTQFNFIYGVTIGVVVEISILLNIGWELIKFVLLHRFWKASRADDEVLPEIPGTPPVFYELSGPGPLPEKTLPQFDA